MAGDGERTLSDRFYDFVDRGLANRAFDLLYPRARAYCRKACASVGVYSEDDQEDVLQQAMEELFGMVAEPSGREAQVTTLLYTIAMRRAIDLIRRRRREAASAMPLEDVDQPDDSRAEAESTLCSKRVLEELARSHPRWFDILLAQYKGEPRASSGEEWARRVGLSHGSLRNVVSQIRARIEALCLEQCGTSDCSATPGG